MGSVSSAKARLTTGDTEGAVAEAGAILDANPNDFNAWYTTACAVCELGDPASGASNLKSLADALANSGQPIFAIQVVKTLEGMGEDTTEILDKIASLYSQKSKRIEEIEITPPPIPAASDIDVWDTAMGPKILMDRAKSAMAQAWGELFTRQDREKLPFVPILSNLSQSDFKLLVGALTLVAYPEDTVVIEQGSKGDGFFIIVEGEVGIVRRGIDGEGKILAKLGPGAFFGEMALVSNARRAAEVRTREYTVLLRVDKRQIETLSERAPEIGRVLIAFCHARMLENLIRISPVLSPVPPQKRPALIGAFTTDYQRAGAVILEEGSSGEGLYLIVSGEVIVTKMETDEEMLLATLGPGDLFGEISLLMRKPSTATVRAKENTALLFLSTDQFMAVTEKYPEFLKGTFDIAMERESENNSILASDARAVDELVLL